MKGLYEYKTIVVTYDNDIGAVGDDLLSACLDDGWEIFRADPSKNSVIYILKRFK